MVSISYLHLACMVVIKHIYYERTTLRRRNFSPRFAYGTVYKCLVDIHPVQSSLQLQGYKCLLHDDTSPATHPAFHTPPITSLFCFTDPPPSSFKILHTRGLRKRAFVLLYNRFLPFHLIPSRRGEDAVFRSHRSPRCLATTRNTDLTLWIFASGLLWNAEVERN